MEPEKVNSQQVLIKIPTELQYEKRSIFIKEKVTQNFWIFDLETHKGINVPTWITVGFQRTDRQVSQNLNHDTFHRCPATSSQGIGATEKYPDAAFLKNYDDGN